MRKRVGLARAISANPEVIVYDEPTTGLDPANVRRVDERVRLLQKKYKVTSIVVSHDMASIYRVADRVALLYDKRAAFLGTLDELKKSKEVLVRKFISGELGDE